MLTVVDHPLLRRDLTILRDRTTPHGLFRKTLSDAAQIRTMIDSFLKQGLEEEIERLILSGDKDSPKGELDDATKDEQPEK